MLRLVDESLEAFLRAEVPLSATDVDVSFETPERDWSAKLSRPTVNLFLWDIRLSRDRSRSGVETVERDGRLYQRPALPRLELGYLLTAWTSDHGDERQLLGGLLAAVLGHPRLPPAYVAAGLQELPPIDLVMSASAESHVEVIKALNGKMKPALNIVVHTAIDPGAYVPAAPPAEDIGIAVADRGGSASTSQRLVAGEAPGAVGARVVSPRGSTVVNPSGRFLVPAAAGDVVVLETDPPRRATVGEVGGIVLA